MAIPVLLTNTSLLTITRRATLLLWCVLCVCSGWMSPSSSSSFFTHSSQRFGNLFPESPCMASVHPAARGASSYYSPAQSTRISHSYFLRLASNNNNNNNQFDMSKPIFDLFSFRNIRSDALLRYNSLKQSEPLRINLFLFASITFILYPTWCESVTGNIATSTSIPFTTLGGMGCAALFWRERIRRSKQLYRMERELNAENLLLRYTPLDSAISSTKYTVRLGELKGKRRILAICGNKEQIGPVWDMVCALRKRFLQSSTLVVFVPTDGSTRKDWGGTRWDEEDDCIGNASATPWLAEITKGDGQGLGTGLSWLHYFRDLLERSESTSESNQQQQQQLAWFALNFKGRSIASGSGEAPRLLELLGQQLQPMVILDETDQADEDGPTDYYSTTQKIILECQQKFYRVLTNNNNSSDVNEMQCLFTSNPVDEVNEVLNDGGRMDAWDKCLENDARPVGMVISGSDAWVPHKNSKFAYSTCIEFPKTKNTTNNSGGSGTSSATTTTTTLLAIQRWVRDNNSNASQNNGYYGE